MRNPRPEEKKIIKEIRNPLDEKKKLKKLRIE